MIDLLQGWLNRCATLQKDQTTKCNDIDSDDSPQIPMIAKKLRSSVLNNTANAFSNEPSSA